MKVSFAIRTVAWAALTAMALALLAGCEALTPAFAKDFDNIVDPKYQAYNIGDKGPAGGIVFYDKGEYSDGWRYMEAAPYNSTVASAYSLPAGDTTTGIGIGTGKANTAAFLAYDPSSSFGFCQSFSQGGKTDWYFPSRDEAEQMLFVVIKWNRTSVWTSSYITGNASPMGWNFSGVTWSCMADVNGCDIFLIREF